MKTISTHTYYANLNGVGESITADHNQKLAAQFQKQERDLLERQKEAFQSIQVALGNNNLEGAIQRMQQLYADAPCGVQTIKNSFDAFYRNLHFRATGKPILTAQEKADIALQNAAETKEVENLPAFLSSVRKVMDAIRNQLENLAPEQLAKKAIEMQKKLFERGVDVNDSDAINAAIS